MRVAKTGNSLMKVISWKNKSIFTEIILLFIRQNTIPYGQSIINAFDHMEFCLVINLTMNGKWAVTWPPIIATGYRLVSYLKYEVPKYLLPTENVNF